MREMHPQSVVDEVAMVLRTPLANHSTMEERPDDSFGEGPYMCWDATLLAPFGFLHAEHVCDPHANEPFAAMLEELKRECCRSPHPYHLIDRVVALFKHIEVVVYGDFSRQHPDLTTFEEPRWSVSIMRFLLWWLDSLTTSDLEVEERRRGGGTRLACRVALVWLELYRFMSYCMRAFVSAGEAILDGGDRTVLGKARYSVRCPFLEADGLRIFSARLAIARHTPYPPDLTAVLENIGQVMRMGTGV